MKAFEAEIIYSRNYKRGKMWENIPRSLVRICNSIRGINIFFLNFRFSSQTLLPPSNMFSLDVFFSTASRQAFSRKNLPRFDLPDFSVDFPEKRKHCRHEKGFALDAKSLRQSEILKKKKKSNRTNSFSSSCNN